MASGSQSSHSRAVQRSCSVLPQNGRGGLRRCSGSRWTAPRMVRPRCCCWHFAVTIARHDALARSACRSFRFTVRKLNGNNSVDQRRRTTMEVKQTTSADRHRCSSLAVFALVRLEADTHSSPRGQRLLNWKLRRAFAPLYYFSCARRAGSPGQTATLENAAQIPDNSASTRG